MLRLSGFEASQQFWPRRTSSSVTQRRAAPTTQHEGGELREEGAGTEHSDGENEPPAGEENDAQPEFLALLDPLLDTYEQPLQVPLLGNADIREDEPSVPVPAGSPADSSQAIADPPPPPEGPPAPKRARRQPGRADCTLVMEWGSIVYYSSNGNFEAICAMHWDERCTLTKGSSASASSSGRSAQAGRPLGYLAAWLAMGPAFGDKASHRDRSVLARLAGPDGHAERKDQRAGLMANPEAADLLARERAVRASEAEEPDRVP